MLYARKVAQTNVTVLITGESGTGKEVLARRPSLFATQQKPFIPFNCTAVPRSCSRVTLFGFKRSFTGADRDNQGTDSRARDGTLFLDEIGELGLDPVPKLLRFLSSRVRSIRSAKLRPSASTSASSPRPTPTCRNSWQRQVP